MSTKLKIVFTAICTILATIGFLIKIPVPLRGHDKLLHTSFYVLAAAFFHFLFRKGLVLIIILLALFGVLIEYLQQMANKFTRLHIHGRFDMEDVYANCKGLGIYLCIALVMYLINKIYQSFRTSRPETKR